MTDPRRPAHPLGPGAPTYDFIPLVARGMTFGVLTGVTWITAALFAVRSLQLGAPPGRPFGPATAALIAGVLGGVLMGASTTWRCLTPLGSYRQGGFTLIAAFATVLLALVTAPVDMLVGRFGLLGVALLAGLGAAAAGRRAAAARAEALRAITGGAVRG